MTGDHSTHPLLLSLTNLDVTIWNKSSDNAYLLLALLPVAKFTHPNSRMRGILGDRLLHQSLDLVLQPLKIAASIGIMLSDPAGKSTLEKIATTMAAVSPSQLEAFFKVCKDLQLNAVDLPFWRDWGAGNPSLFLLPELLHHLHKFFWDHGHNWCIAVVGAAELDYRCSLLQMCTGYWAFREGIAKLKKAMGWDHRNSQRYLIGVVAGTAPTNFGVVPSICSHGALMQWTADVTEHAHIDIIKVPACSRNKKDYNPQICRYLDHLDKCIHFNLATSLHKETQEAQLEDRSEVNDNDNAGDGAQPRREVVDYFAHACDLILSIYPDAPRPFRTFATPITGFHLRYNPPLTCMTVDSAAEDFGLQDFRPTIGDFLEWAKHGSAHHDVGGRHRAQAGCPLAFKRIQISLKNPSLSMCSRRPNSNLRANMTVSLSMPTLSSTGQKAALKVTSSLI
ncbi:hypothetical protein BV22DRAFT_1051691 [Leucogyrophana mollusca]|uniref:Uncharacterized protein n=1 Tax=Leucogyrophana mollusca TaxID=85980 RepID=A0ACB8AYL5_9AGAM|nr:hypothetical protein BV22DRAFT_1051691 [Leucogyrophana mollusca]